MGIHNSLTVQGEWVGLDGVYSPDSFYSQALDTTVVYFIVVEWHNCVAPSIDLTQEVLTGSEKQISSLPSLAS